MEAASKKYMADSGWRGPRPPVRWPAMCVPTQMAFGLFCFLSCFLCEGG
jgi:hypothetical protein